LQPEDHSEYGWFTEAEITHLPSRPADDPEFAIIRKGFALLRGERLAV
jgi:hypothetical protein